MDHTQTVVGFHNGKISTNTTDAPMFGIISERPLVLGSKEANATKRGAVVAYCGESSTLIAFHGLNIWESAAT